MDTMQNLLGPAWTPLWSLVKIKIGRASCRERV